MDDRWKLPVFTHLIHLVTRMIMTRPTLFVLDEAWTYFREPFMAKKILECLKLARRRNCGVVPATQSLADIDPTTPLGSAMLTECMTKIFTPNAGADRRERDVDLYRNAGLTDHEIYRIANTLRRANDYYYTSPVGRRPFSLDLKGLALAMCASTSGTDLTRAGELIHANPRGWVADFLTERGLPDWGAAWVGSEIGSVG
jgi:type IV secretion system protein VirB4